MEVYKKIAAVSERDALERIHAELEDRFGPIPEEVSSLLSLAEIKIICRRLSIATLRERGGVVTLEFARVSDCFNPHIEAHDCKLYLCKLVKAHG